MRTLNRTLGLYLFFLITFTSASVFAFKFEINSNGRMTLSQDDSGDHLIWISGCSFNEGSQGEIDAFFAMATWNDPAVARSVFRGEWVSCLTSEESGRWSRNHDDDIGNRLMSQILVSDHMDKKVVGQIRRTRNFSRNEATAFTIFVKPDYRRGRQTPAIPLQGRIYGPHSIMNSDTL